MNQSNPFHERPEEVSGQSDVAANDVIQDNIKNKSFPLSESAEKSKSKSSESKVDINLNKKDQAIKETASITPIQTPTSRSLAIHLFGSLETGHFESVNDVYIKYTIVAGPDWVLSSGTDVGITQISRYNSYISPKGNWREFVWNQPISASYRSYNYYGWPQIVLSVYYFNAFGNDQILGYGAAHLPISCQLPADFEQHVEIYAPQSSSMVKQILSWLTGKKPELVDSALFARPDCRRVLQVVRVGQIKLKFNITSKDVISNGYKS